MSTWKPWITVRSSILANVSSETTTADVSTTSASPRLNFEEIERPDILFPYSYTPATAFWLRALMNNCDIFWTHPGDLLSNYMMGGGITGTLVGSVAGLNLVAYGNFFQSKIWGYGYGYPIPQVGYCIGDKFKQQVYVKFDIANTMIKAESLRLPTISLLQNSRFQRLFLNHGTVSKYSVVIIKNANGTTEKEHHLSLDIDNAFPINGVVAGNSCRINITGKEGNASVKIKSISSNWDFIIEDPKININSGDFYELNETWCLEDPFLMSGIWYGSDTQKRASDTGKISSGKGLYWSSHQSFYEEGDIIGVYTWQNKSSSGEVEVPPPNISMRDYKNSEWRWKFFAWDSPEGYDKRRFKEILGSSDELPVNYPNVIQGSVSQYGTFFGSSVGWIERTDATDSDLQKMYDLKDLTRVRVEINRGGTSIRHNWFAPCLKDQYIKIDKAYYRILDHIEAGIIDVSIKSVDGKSEFKPKKSQKFSILNHKSWQIVEDYSLAESANATTGIFRGTISRLAYNEASNTTSLTLQDITDNFSTLASFNSVFEPYDDNISQNNLAQRYKINHNHLVGEPLQKYKKFQNWKLSLDNVDAKDSQNKAIKITQDYPIISSISFPSNSSNAYAPYSISLTVRGNLTNPSLKDKQAYISFDTPYRTVGNAYKQTGFSFDMDIAESSGSLIIWQTFGRLCLRGEYQANPFYLDIPKNTMIGFCEGTYFGFTIQGTNFYSKLMFLITTLTSAKGLASLFHALRQEDWVVYVDKQTDRLTVRRGSLNYQEYPMKTEVVISKPLEKQQGASGSEIPLDTKFDRLRRIQFKLPKKDSYIMFGLGSEENMYGFVIGGRGKVDLQALRRDGIGEGQKPVESYQWNGFSVAPVYIYTQCNWQNLENLHADIGTATSNGPIHIINGTVNGSILQYAENKQTIQEASIFDVIRLKDGENIIIYCTNLRPFNIDGSRNQTVAVASDSTSATSSSEASSGWNIPQGIMVTGTWDENFYWGAPNAKDWNKNANYQYPVMVLNGVEYLTSLYNPMNNTISFFFKGSDEYKNFFVGCLTISVLTFLHETYLATDCKPEEKTAQLNFLWRPVLAEPPSDKKWSQQDIVGAPNYLKKEDVEKKKIPKDIYDRILGGEGTNSQVTSSEEINIASAHMLPDGTYLLFYDYTGGIKVLFSADSGRTWRKSNVNIAKGGFSAILVDRFLFYLTAEGIEIKQTSYADFYELREGAGQANKEQTIQERFDSIRHFLIGTSLLPVQKFSGYITSEGIIKIFYYDEQGLLNCMDSPDSTKWSPADNF